MSWIRVLSVFRRQVALLWRVRRVIERMAIHSAPIVVPGETNMHLDDVRLSVIDAACFYGVPSGANLVQHVSGSTHRTVHTLDVITENDTAMSATADPPTISNQSLTISSDELQLAVTTASATYTRRQRAEYDCDAFRGVLVESTFFYESIYRRRRVISLLRSITPSTIWIFGSPYGTVVRRSLSQRQERSRRGRPG